MQIWEAMKWNGEKIAFGHHEKSRPWMYVWKSKAIKQNTPGAKSFKRFFKYKM